MLIPHLLVRLLEGVSSFSFPDAFGSSHSASSSIGSVSAKYLPTSCSDTTPSSAGAAPLGRGDGEKVRLRSQPYVVPRPRSSHSHDQAYLSSNSQDSSTLVANSGSNSNTDAWTKYTPLCLSPTFEIVIHPSVSVSGSSSTTTSSENHESHVSDDLHRAINRTLSRVRNGRMEYLSVHGGREFFDPPPFGSGFIRESGYDPDPNHDFSSGSFEGNDEGDVPDCAYYLDRLVLHMIDYGGSSIMDQATAPVEQRTQFERYTLDLALPRTSGDILDYPTFASELREDFEDEERAEGTEHTDGNCDHHCNGGNNDRCRQHTVGTLTAPGPLGLLRGLTTFEQMWYYLPPPSPDRSFDDGEEVEKGVRYAPFAPYHVDDQPEFGWRGLLLDTSRHFFGMESIKRTLETMSMVKLNVFQWHITDSNSFPLSLSTHPELAQKGAYSPREIYAEQDIRDIVKFAGERGIDVVLEIDTPGHTAAIAASHPSHVACYERTPWVDFAHQPPAGQLRFAHEGVANWTASLLGVVADLSGSRYFSTGGDETNERCMLEDGPTVVELNRRNWTLNQALDQFTNVSHSALRNKGKTAVVWQEMALDHGDMVSLQNDTVVEVWVDSSDAKKVLKKGYRIVHAAANYLYLDCGQGGWIGKPGGAKCWCDPFKTWSRIYSFDPYRDVEEEDRHLILGGQVSLWTEQTDETNLDVLWPRAAAAAEVFWSGPTANSSTSEALVRMHDIRYRMVQEGVRAVPLQPHWCAIRPGACMEGG